MRKLILTFVLGTLCLGAFSQEAFYIYRNDGDFNGFFYDEVVEMRQSKIGVDSIEYDRWVTQEVVLADTIYRIPLAAIDSIGFQQPEIIFNPQLRHMDLLEMTPYVTARDSQTLTFSNELPTSLMPQVGNVLVGFTGILEEGGFGGRVTSVTPSGNSIIVETEELTKMSDIFVKFITIEEVGVLEDDPNQVVCRMAGLKKIKQWEGSGNISLFNINLNLHFPIDPGSGAAGSSLDASIYFRSKLVMVYKIEEDVFFIKAGASQELGLESSLTLKLSGSPDLKPADLIKPAISIKYPVTVPIPLFQMDPMPKVGVRCGGEFDMKINFPGISGSLSEVFTFDSDDPNLMSFKFTPKFNTTPIGDIIDFAANTDFEFKAEGFVQGGLMVECAIKTNQWVSKIFSASCGVDIWAGPKLNLAFDISGKALMSGDGPYTFSDSYLGMNLVSLDAEAYSKGSFLGKEVKHTWLDGSIDVFPRLNFYFLNKFSNFQAEHSDNSHILRASWDMDLRSTLYPHRPGIAVYHKRNATPKIIYSDYTDLPIKVSEDDAISQHFDIMQRTVDWSAGQYFAVPSLTTSDGEHPVYSMAQSFYVPLWAKPDKDKTNISATGGSVTIDVASNGGEIRKVEDPEYEKITVQADKKSVTVTVDNIYDSWEPHDTLHLGSVEIPLVVPEDTTQTITTSIEITQVSDPSAIYDIIYMPFGHFLCLHNNKQELASCHVTVNDTLIYITGSSTTSGTVQFGGDNRVVGFPMGVTCGFSCYDATEEECLKQFANVMQSTGTETVSYSFNITVNKRTGKATGTARNTVTENYSGYGMRYHVEFSGNYSFDGSFYDGTVSISSLEGTEILSGNAHDESGDSSGKDENVIKYGPTDVWSNEIQIRSSLLYH